FEGLEVSDAQVAFQHLFSYIAFVATIPVLLLLGGELVKRWFWEIRETKNVISLDGIAFVAISAAFLKSVYNLWVGEGHTYFETVTMTLLFITGGRLIIGSIKGQMKQSLATQIKDIEKQNSALKVGETVELVSGDEVPVDGELLTQGYFDEASLTGESQVVLRKIGETVLSGAVVVDSPIKLKVTRSGNEHTLAKLETAVNKALVEKGKLRALIDKIAKILFFITVVISAGVFTYWYQTVSLEEAILNAMAVLLVSCPCALGIAVPIVSYQTILKALASKILIQNPQVLETIPKVKHLFFDKTGTLTNKNFSKIRVELSEEFEDLLFSIVSNSKHPISVRVAKELKKSKILELQNLKEITGFGLQAEFEGKVYKFGSKDFCGIEETDSEFTEVYFTENSTLVGKVSLEPELREGVKEVLAEIPVADKRIISGDRRKPTELIAEFFGIKGVANLKPEEKLSLIEETQKSGILMMVGDGLNDAPSLAKADIGVTFSFGTDLSKISSDVVILSESLNPLKELFELATFSRKKMYQNVFWTLAYNSVAMILACFGLLHPIVATFVMFTSSIFVIWNSYRK
ncbi:MAG: cation-transporting P-type ATPase, partial [Calditrichaeota bacterium]